MNYKKGIVFAAILALIVIIGFLVYNYEASSDNYIISINGEKVNVGEFKFMLETVRARMEQQGLTNFDTIVDGKKASDLAKERALESIVNYKTGAQQARVRNIALTEQEIKKINDDIDKVIAQNPKVMESLKSAGLSVDDFKRMNMEFSLSQKLKTQEIEGIKKNITIIDEELKDYYNKNKDQFTFNQEMVRAKHILIKTTDANENELPKEQQEQAKSKAEGILNRAKAGEDFAGLAKQYSEDLGSKDNGGEYTFPRGQMVEEFENTAFSLKRGEISNLVKTRFGYHIIKLEEKYEKGQIMSFESIKDKEEFKVEAQYNKILEDWKKKSQIIRNDKLYNSL